MMSSLIQPLTPWLILAACCAVVMGVLIRALTCRREVARPTMGSLLRGQAGTATVEFALIIPFIVTIGLILAQITVLMVGRIVVGHAAFAAARAAIVQIPADHRSLRDGEGPNVLTNEPTSPKMQAIRQAAALAVVPVCGKSSNDHALSTPFTGMVRSHYEYFGQATPRWVSDTLPLRVNYAFENTDVVVGFPSDYDLDTGVEWTEVGPGDTLVFAPRSAVTAHVFHRLSIIVPYVGRIFRDGTLPDGGSYVNVQAAHTMRMDGTVPTLPPLPPPYED